MTSIFDFIPYMKKLLRFILLFAIAFSVLVQSSYAQDKQSTTRSLSKKQRKAMRARDSVLRSFNKSDTSINNLLQRLEQYTTSFNQIKNNLAAGLDTADISQKIPSIIKRISKIQTQANTHKSSTLRYLFVLRDNLDHIQDVLQGWQTDLDAVDDKLVQNQTDLIKFSKDSLLIKTVPSDSILRSVFFAQRKTARKLWHNIDSTNRSNLFKVNFLQNRVAIAFANVLDGTDQIDSKVSKFAARAFDGEFGNIWEIDPQYNNLKTSVNGTINLNNLQLYYFITKETATHFVSLVFLVLFIGWIYYNRQKIKREHTEPELILNQASYIYKQTLVAALLVPVIIIPYFYDHPPVAFLECFFIVSLILILILVKKAFHPKVFSALQQLFFVTLVYSASNLLIQITNADRFAILFLSIVSIIIAYSFSRKVKATPADFPKNTGIIVKVFIGLQLISLLFDLSCRFSLEKITGITATYNLWLLIGLYFVVEIISQALLLQFHPKKDSDSLISWIDHALLQKKFRAILNVLASVLWLFSLCQNLNIEDAVTDYVSDILSQGHTVGGASFTFGGFVIFIAVIWLSSVLSKIVSYFYDISAQHPKHIDALKKKNRTSTLLIRIGVFTVGFFLAVFASNFPLDKITIIISAFCIGIGFGLQNIVNNLVSGLILAFEKPIQIGDVIEVDTHSGTIKEIGVRSMKLATFDGSEVIIPNGDLISHHVVNWTLSNSNRRIELVLTTAYGCEIEKVKGLLKDLLNGREDVMTQPGPSVFLHNITESSADFRIFFWAADIGQFLELKSMVLADIYAAFDKEGIEMPSGIKDINIHFADDVPAITVNSKNE